MVSSLKTITVGSGKTIFCLLVLSDKKLIICEIELYNPDSYIKPQLYNITNKYS